MTSGPTGVHSLTKDFGEVRALDEVSLTIQPGEIHALLGANGAGKSTLMRCLLAYLQPTSGTVSVLGGDSADPRVRARIGYLPGDIHLPPRSTVTEVVSFHARLLTRAGRPPRQQDPLISRLQLDTRKRIGTLSKGNRQKVGLVLALMADPDVLVLDEPTAGLDPFMQGEVLDILRGCRAAGTAILLSTHILAEAEAVADRVAVLSRGRLMADRPLGQLVEQARQALAITLERPAPATILQGVPGIGEATVSDRSVDVVIVGTAAHVIAALAPYGVQRITAHAHEIDEMFLSAGEQRT
jgi:ABC-2 type transport system ATP-binding protein